MENGHSASPPMHPCVKLDLAVDQVEKELTDIKGYETFVGSLMYEAHATQTDIIFTVAALCQFDCRPFTSHPTAAR
jgi:hypothetical protein